MKETHYDRAPRNAASRAVLNLRTTLGQTQQSFATDIKTALTTVSRWEGRLPPHGETLLRLRDVAEKAARRRNVPKPEVERLIQIRDVFHELYWRELLSDKDAQLITFLPTETKPVRGYLLVKVEGDIEIDAARKVLVLGVANAVKNTPEVSDE
jgi:transcriptional regulator with XRE-family HTH domain